MAIFCFVRLKSDNQHHEHAVAAIKDNTVSKKTVGHAAKMFSEMLTILLKLPGSTVLFMANGERGWGWGEEKEKIKTFYEIHKDRIKTYKGYISK